MQAKALAKYAPEEYRPGSAIQSEEALVRAAGELGTTIFHPVGTCKMGRDALAGGGRKLRGPGTYRLPAAVAGLISPSTSRKTNRPTRMTPGKVAPPRL